MLWLYILLNFLGTDLKGTLCQVCCDECQIWVHVECDLTCNNVEVISLPLFDDILISLLLDIYMQLFYEYLLLTWHSVCHRIWKRQITTVRIANQNAKQFQQWKK